MTNSPSSPREVQDSVTAFPDGWSRRIQSNVFSNSIRPKPRTSGVYGLLNTANNKIYIGSSQRVNWRLNCHLSEFRSKSHSNKVLMMDFEVNPSAFEFVLLEEVSGPVQLKSREKFWVYFFDSVNPDKGYNSTLRFCRRMKPSEPTGRSPWTMEKRLAMSAMASKEKRPICQFDFDGNLVRTWESVKAAARAFGKDKGVLSCALRKPSRSFCGFRWKYA